MHPTATDGRRPPTLVAQQAVRAAGLGFVEGPVLRQCGDIVAVSLDHGCLYQIGEDGARRLTNTGGAPNGAVEAADGTLFIAQNGGSWPGSPARSSAGGIQRVATDGSVDWLTLDPIAPNDLCFGPDGMLYVTDPTRQTGLDDGRLWRVHPESGASELLCSVPWFPNGIAFGASDDALFVASTRDGLVYRFAVTANGLGQAEVFSRGGGAPDGMAFDANGNLLVAAVGTPTVPGVIEVWDPTGSLLDVVALGTSRYYTNLALSAVENLLLVTDSDAGTLLAIEWPVLGLPLHPFR